MSFTSAGLLPKTNIVMARKQYKPGQFYWIKGKKYRIARVERHVQDPCDKCDVSSLCIPSMMNWCADLMPTHYYFKRVKQLKTLSKWKKQKK